MSIAKWSTLKKLLSNVQIPCHRNALSLCIYTYPNFTNNLSQFKSLAFRKPNEIPEVFKTYCPGSSKFKK